MKCVKYKAGYKYQLKEVYVVQISIRPRADIRTPYVSLSTAGVLEIKEGYAWDGPSGPTVDTLTFMRGSLVHDALYQLMRDGHLDRSEYREAADRILRDICREDGMWAVRAWYVYEGVRFFADPAADPAGEHPLVLAPRGCEP
jgi:hypothetical protein